MDSLMTCKELAEILLKTPDKPVMIAKAELDGDLLNTWIRYLNKQRIKTITLKDDGTEAIVLDDEPWVMFE